MLIHLLVVLLIIGLVMFVIERLTPLDRNIKTIIYIVILLVAVLYVLSAFGLVAGVGSL